MDLDLSEEQELLRATTDRFVREQGPMSVIREWADGKPVPEAYYRRAASLGWYAPMAGLLTDSEDARLGLREAAVIAEERGRTLQPGPFVSTSVAVAALRCSGGSDRAGTVLDGLVAGETSATWAADWSHPSADSECDLRIDIDGTGAGANAAGGGVRIFGSTPAVEYGGETDWVLVSGKDSSGELSQVLVSTHEGGVTIERRQNLDVTRRLASIRFDGSGFESAICVGEPGRSATDLETQRDIAACLVAAEMVGAMDALFEQTRRYALERVAFGRQIGSFQAIKHQLADLSLAVESSKAISSVATRAVDGGEGFASEAASVAKAWASDAAMSVAQGCFQIFGGIGFTWEHDCHLYFRRLTMDGLLFGSAAWHRARLCDLLDGLGDR